MSTYDICFSLWLTSLCMTGPSMSLQMAFFIPFHDWVMYHIFFIHSSVDGHLDCLHILAIVNSAAMNIGVHVSFLSYNFLRCLPCSGIAGSYSNSMFRFLRNFHYCSWKWLYQFTFPPTVQEGFLFSIPSSAFIVCRYFDDGSSDQCEVIPHCSFDLHFSNN